MCNTLDAKVMFSSDIISPISFTQASCSMFSLLLFETIACVRILVYFLYLCLSRIIIQNLLIFCFGCRLFHLLVHLYFDLRC